MMWNAIAFALFAMSPLAGYVGFLAAFSTTRRDKVLWRGVMALWLGLVLLALVMNGKSWFESNARVVSNCHLYPDNGRNTPWCSDLRLHMNEWYNR